MSINKKHPNYSKSKDVLRGKVTRVAQGPNRVARRGEKYRNLPKQFHLAKAHVSMMMVEHGLLSKPKV